MPVTYPSTLGRKSGLTNRCPSPEDGRLAAIGQGREEHLCCCCYLRDSPLNWQRRYLMPIIAPELPAAGIARSCVGKSANDVR